MARFLHINRFEYDFIVLLTINLKKSKKLKMPADAILFKAGKCKKLIPINADWFYLRCASILRRMYKRGPIGIGKLREMYGGRRRRAFRPRYFSIVADGLLIVVLKALSQAKMIKFVPGGRTLTYRAQRKIYRLAQIIAHVDREILAIKQKQLLAQQRNM
ncbi:40S ribosomal protein S19-like [Teleopsis dalmanni]|uniref:40S ribosomal protein S19-like n=1 Tax=Teleopsis dalmanni TaxID=139649 RepID=UPI0018CD4BE6|nr:40S ribosomal protein S19-like [Teleopsis dalmanni]